MICEITVEAKADIQEIWLHIAQDNPTAANSVEEDIYSACQWVAQRPGVGHRRRSLTRAPVLFWTVRTSYLVVYRIVPGGVEILRVLHAARDAEEELG